MTRSQVFTPSQALILSEAKGLRISLAVVTFSKKASAVFAVAVVSGMGVFG